MTALVAFSFLKDIHAQAIGGNAAYNFLKLPSAPQLSALGGINVSNISSDLGLATNNPALLRTNLDQQLMVSFNALYAGVKNFSSAYAYRYEPWSANFSAAVHFLDYGNIITTDASGNISGNMRPRDYSVQLSASRSYEKHWHYGATVKFINSNYGIYRSSAIALDLGVNYYDSTKGLQAGLLLKNMGAQLKKYEGSSADGLPFDIQLGITKKLANAPLQFSFTAHHLHQFDIRYADTAFDNSNGMQGSGRGSFTIDKVFRHFVFAAQVFVSDKIELTAGYNHLKRRELVISNSATGLTGFSIGAGATFRKLQIRYARSHYQNNTGYNQFALNLPLDKF